MSVHPSNAAHGEHQPLCRITLYSSIAVRSLPVAEPKNSAFLHFIWCLFIP